MRRSLSGHWLALRLLFADSLVVMHAVHACSFTCLLIQAHSAMLFYMLLEGYLATSASLQLQLLCKLWRWPDFTHHSLWSNWSNNQDGANKPAPDVERATSLLNFSDQSIHYHYHHSLSCGSHGHWVIESLLSSTFARWHQDATNMWPL